MLKEFISSNGIEMVEGHKYNWEKSYKYHHGTIPNNPFSLLINVSNDKMDHIQFMYNLESFVLSISSHTATMRFQIGANIGIAEAMIDSYCLANNTSEVMPLFQKNFNKKPRADNSTSGIIPDHKIW